MSQLINHHSKEKEILIEILEEIPNMDSYWISTIIENYLYGQSTFTLKDKTIVKVNKIEKTYHGLCEEFYPNGKLKKKYTYDNNKLNGEMISYYKNGTIKTKKYYIQGNLFGDLIGYYPNGNIRITCSYNEKGEQIKDFISYSLSGDILMRNKCSEYNSNKSFCCIM